MWWTVRVYNEAGSDLKIYLKCDEKKLYFKTLKSKMVYLSILCVLFILDAQYWKQRLRWRYDVEI